MCMCKLQFAVLMLSVHPQQARRLLGCTSNFLLQTPNANAVTPHSPTPHFSAPTRSPTLSVRRSVTCMCMCNNDVKV